MGIYVFIEAIIGIIAGVLFATRTKKAEGVTYSKLDRVGAVINSVFFPLYVFALPFCLTIGWLSHPNHDGILGVLGWMVSFFTSSAPLFCGLSLGISVALRKRGKGKLGFAIQFVGAIAIILTFVLFFSLYGNLLAPLKHPV